MPPASELTDLPSVETLSYPFERHGMPAAEQAWVDDALTSMQDRFELFEAPRKSCRTVSVFVGLCSVGGLPEETVRVAAELVGLTIYFNDRIGASDCAPLLDASLRALLDPLDVVDRAPSTLASAAFAQRLAPHVAAAPHNAVGFLQATTDTWTAFRWESEQLSELPAALEDYRRLRAQTIAVQPYLRCFRLMMGLAAPTYMRNAQLLMRAEQLSTEVQYLANDLGSVSRDLARGQRNAVLLRSATDDVPIPEAWHLVRTHHDVVAQELTSCLATLRQRDSEPTFHRFLDQIEACTWGNLRALTMLAQRYNRDAPEL